MVIDWIGGIMKNPGVVKTLKSIIWKVALYIRLSKEDGNEVSLSISNQIEILQKYINASSEQFIIYDIYIEMKMP